jgi:hypothetical protein
MSGDVEFMPIIPCDRCGNEGAWDFMGDYFCDDCLTTDDEGYVKVKDNDQG